MTSTRNPQTPGLRLAIAEREQAAAELADEIVALVNARRAAGAVCVLGLATGSTPRGLYARLRSAAREGRVDFAGVTTVNLDEFLGLPPDDPRSFRSEMQRELFDDLGLPPERTWFPPLGDDPARLERDCARFEVRLRELGGIDLQVLGVGRNGHLGFNEPGSARDSRTRAVELDSVTRADAVARFGGPTAVPRRAVTLGLATILEARALRVAAFGAAKAEVLARALEGPVGPQLPASFLREHGNCRLWLDAAASARLVASRAPRP